MSLLASIAHIPRNYAAMAHELGKLIDFGKFKPKAKQ
jgi:hypothetical protein